MDKQMSFIEKQFPVSKVSKESYKERKANNGQTLTGLGKWWGRKPLILVRAAILGCLMPCSDNPKTDMEIFLKILSMDDEGLLDRKQKRIPIKRLYEIANNSKQFKQYLNDWFEEVDGKLKIRKGQNKEDIEKRLFKSLGYDEKLKYCVRPEQLEEIRNDSWNAINQHLGTSAHTLVELVNQLSIKRYGHLITVGDCFSGGGSIPFEAARMGAQAYGSDLNPVATLLTWANINILGCKEQKIKELRYFQKNVFDEVFSIVEKLGVERNEKGDNAVCYLYCLETSCPECGSKIPLAPSWVIGKGTKTVAILKKNGNEYDIKIKMNASNEEMKTAEMGTVSKKGLICPSCGVTTPISIIRGDRTDEKGNTIYGLRSWEKSEFGYNEDDVYSERLYAIKYEHKDIYSDGKVKITRYYRDPNEHDLANEKKLEQIVAENIIEWQDKGFIPSMTIKNGEKTIEVIRNRGWSYWNHLFNARQLFTISSFLREVLKQSKTQTEFCAGILGVNKLCNFNSKLSRFNPGAGVEKVVDVFFNQALNTLFNYGCLGMLSTGSCWEYTINNYELSQSNNIELCDARNVENTSDFWITDPPYADAINYHELTEFFLAWDKRLLQEAFPEWYTDSKRILAVRGDEHFSETMIEIYTNLTNHMSDDGMQVVMFTHSDPAVWAQLALIMWKSGLRVTAAWNIATETDASGLKEGNYVKGTVLLVLRKQTGDEMAFLDEINSDIRAEVRNQIASMLELENKEEPNFSDPDFVLAAYAASLKVLTSFKTIEDLDLDYELNLAINNPSKSSIVKIIENAKKIAYDCVIPLDFESYLWKDLTNAEKFYVKGLESEKHGNYQIGTYQEFARGFNIGSYGKLMASEKANSARLKTPFEMAGRSLNDIPDFEKSLLRTIFMGIYTGIKEDENPSKALGYIKNELSGYWEKRDMIKQLLSFIKDTKDIDNMAAHWEQSGDMAELLYSLVTNDSI
jgi:adenine-specific DNA methylase